MRDLTTNERAVLAHVVFEPVAWWEHVQSKDGSDGKRALNAEACLAAKVQKYSGEYEAALARDGADYKTRSEREALETPFWLVEK